MAGIDIDKLTLGEVATVEKLSGLSIAAIGDDDAPKGAALAALAYITKKREVPGFTWSQAQDLTFAQAQEILGLEDDDEDDAESSDEDGEQADPFVAESSEPTLTTPPL